MPTNLYPEAALELLERIERLEKLFTGAKGIAASWHVNGLEASGGVEATLNIEQTGTYLVVQGATGFTEHAPGVFTLLTYLDGKNLTEINEHYQNIFFHNSNAVHHRYNDIVALLTLKEGTHKLRWENGVNNIIDNNDFITGFLTLAEALPGPEGPKGKEGPEGETKNPLYVNVKKYGAKGENTDDTVAIENAIEAAGENGTIFFPASSGEYGLSKALNIKYGHFTIAGAGKRGASLKLLNGSNSAMITTPDDKVQRYGLCIKDIGFDGNAANQVGESNVIDIHGMNECEIENVYIKNPRGNAIKIGQVTAGIFNTVPKFDNVMIRGDATNSQLNGIALESGSSDAQVTECDIGLFTLGVGILASGHSGYELIGNQCWQNKNGYQIFQSSRGRIVGCLSDLAKQHGFVVQNSNDTMLIGCQSRESGQTKAKEYDGFIVEGTIPGTECKDTMLVGCRAMGFPTRHALNLHQRVDHTTIIGGNFQEIAEGGFVEGVEITNTKFIGEPGSLIETAALELTSLSGGLPGINPNNELGWWRKKSSEVWANLIAWWNAKEELFTSKWFVSGEANETAGKGLLGVGIVLVNNLKAATAEIRVFNRGSGLLLLNNAKESAWLKSTEAGRKSFTNFGTSVVTYTEKGLTASEEITITLANPKSFIGTATSETGQYSVCLVELEPLEEVHKVKIIVRSLTGEVAAGTKVTVNWMVFATG